MLQRLADIRQYQTEADGHMLKVIIMVKGLPHVVNIAARIILATKM
jgi:hypothetical protein